MKRLFFLCGLVVWSGIMWCSNLRSNSPCEPLRTTPYSHLGTAIDIKLPDKNGIMHNLASYRGTPCIVCFIKGNLVSERCILLSYLSRLHPWFQQKGIQLFGISTEPIETCIEDNALIPFPLLFDHKQIVSKKYCTDAYSPFGSAFTTFILDKNSAITRVLNMASIEELVAQLMISVLELNGDLTTQDTDKDEVQRELNKQTADSSMERSITPDIELFDSNGNLVRLSDYRDTWVLLSFADNIRGTREYERFLYRLNEIYKWLQQHNITILCACAQPVEELARFQKHSGLQYYLLSDDKRIIPERFEEPWCFYNEFLSYLIDPTGNKVTSFISASADLHFAQLCHYIIIHEIGAH
ncbi:TPA: hypothetical protein DDZ86_02225 [Candidatus Dependentiae bacterium]|nr:MAG: hypothetical protein UW09_C0001G0201 [candidate division TM6 bacterium GW2011_GWF2_43_87]HBL98435.1 hypothetical protein [Candidatus Dependentiae bacterium]